MKTKIFLPFAIFTVLFFIFSPIVFADTLNIEILKPVEPVNANSSFEILAVVSTQDDNFFKTTFHEETVPGGEAITMLSISGGSVNGRGGVHFQPQQTGRLYYIDLNFNHSAGGSQECLHVFSTVGNKDVNLFVELHDYNNLGYNIDQNLAKVYLPTSNIAFLNTNFMTCRVDFFENNITLQADINYTVIFGADTTAGSGGAIKSTADANTIFNDNFFNVSDDLWNWGQTNQKPEFRIQLFKESTDTNVSTADVNMQFSTDANVAMPFSSGFYRHNDAGRNSGTLPFTVYAGSVAGVDNSSASSTLRIIKKLSSFLTFTEITNIASHSLSPNDNNITIDVDNEASLIEWRVDSNSNFSETVRYQVENALNDGKQYFVFTANQSQRDINNWVFNSSLTYGTAGTFDDPVQKIFDGNKYVYTFEDTLGSNETKYYRLTYRRPALFFETLTNSDEWFKQLQPEIVEIDNKNYDSYTVSSFSNLRNELIESIPQLLSSENVAFELQFTAFTETGTATLSSGLTNEAGTSDTTQNVTIGIAKKRFSVDINSLGENQRLLMKTSETASKTIYVTDYALVQRGHFTNRLKITKENNEPLDVIVINSASNQYIREGKISEARTSAYDREGDLNKLRIEVFLDTTDDTNRVVFKETELTGSAETVFNFVELIPQIIDLNGTSTAPSTPRNVKVVLTLFDTNGLAVEEQSDFFTFIQFPYFADDLEFFITPLEKKVGEFPNGIFSLIAKDPSTILGIKLRIFDEDSTLSSPDKTKIFYKDIDFECVALDCGFDWELDDFKYADQNNYTIAGTVLLNTENESTNPLVHKEIIVLVSFRVYETLRVFETFERTTHAYNNTEEIGLVLQVRTSDYSNLKKNISTDLQFSNCDSNVLADANCMVQVKKYSPITFLYDTATGYNYWFFKQIFTDDDGTLFDDGNHYRVFSNITDLESKHQPTLASLLVPRCQTDGSDWLSNMLSFLHFVFGCQAYTSEKVTTTENTAESIMLNIDNGKSLNPPTYEGILCVSPDQNNLYVDGLSQPIVCSVFYTLAESPVDSFSFEIQNENSDNSITDDSEIQFIKETIPFDLIAFNDLTLMRKALEKEGNTIDTLGEFFAEGFNKILVGTANPLLSEADLLTNSGIVTNIGFDVNLNKIFSPTNISGAFFIRFDGIGVINKNDFRGNDAINNSSGKFFRRVANLEGQSITIPQTHMTIYASDFVKVIEKDIDSPLVIDVDPNKVNQAINTQNIDANENQNFDFVPSLLKFDIVSNLSYNNQLSNIRRFLSITIAENIKTKFNFQDVLEFFDDLVENPVETSIQFIFGSLLLITILVLIAYILAVIAWRNRTSGGRGG